MNSETLEELKQLHAKIQKERDQLLEEKRAGEAVGLDIASDMVFRRILIKGRKNRRKPDTY